jgi:hypothetical protein
LDTWHAFIGEEFDDAALFNFHGFDSFSPMHSLLPARWSISTAVLFTHRNRGYNDHFHVTHFANDQPRKESLGQCRPACSWDRNGLRTDLLFLGYRFDKFWNSTWQVNKEQLLCDHTISPLRLFADLYDPYVRLRFGNHVRARADYLR